MLFQGHIAMLKFSVKSTCRSSIVEETNRLQIRDQRRRNPLEPMKREILDYNISGLGRKVKCSRKVDSLYISSCSFFENV